MAPWARVITSNFRHVPRKAICRTPGKALKISIPASFFFFSVENRRGLSFVCVCVRRRQPKWRNKIHLQW